MQPVAQRYLSRLCTRRLSLCYYRYFLCRAPTAPSRVPVSTSTLLKLCPSIGKLLRTLALLPRSNDGSPHPCHPAQGGGQASLAAPASGCHIGPRPAEGSNYPAQHAGETAPGREIQKDGGVRCSEPSRKRAAEIAVHHPFRLVDESRYLALPCLPIGLSPSRTPIMLIEMYDWKPGDPGDLPGEGRLSGAGTAEDEHPLHRHNLHAFGRPTHRAAGSAIFSPAGPIELGGSVIAFVDDPGDGCGIDLDQRSKERRRSYAQAGPLPLW